MPLFYIWADLFWFGAYNVDYETETKLVAKIVRPHLVSAFWGVVLVIAAILHKKFGPHPYHDGFPGYFTILVIGFIPTLAGSICHSHSLPMEIDNNQRPDVSVL